MKQGLPKLVAVIVISLALAGCSGGLGVGTLLGLVDVGEIVAGIGAGLFGPGQPSTAQVYLDGQPIREISAGDTEVALTDIPAGDHRLHVVVSARNGATSIINLEPGRTVSAPLTAYAGGRITGTVTLQDGEAGAVAAERVMVYAIPGGGQLLLDGGTVALPGDMPPYAAFTSTTGAYDLSALEPGSYLVIAAVAGYMTDLHLVELSAGQTRSNVDLVLRRDGSLQPGRVSGIVRSTAGIGLANGSVRAHLANGYQPAIPQEAVDRIAEATGITELPVFRFEVLSTLTAPDGRYRLPLMAGSPELHGFVFGNRPAMQEVNVVAGQVTTANFELRDS